MQTPHKSREKTYWSEDRLADLCVFQDQRHRRVSPGTQRDIGGLRAVQRRTKPSSPCTASQTTKFLNLVFSQQLDKSEQFKLLFSSYIQEGFKREN